MRRCEFRLLKRRLFKRRLFNQVMCNRTLSDRDGVVEVTGLADVVFGEVPWLLKLLGET